MHYQFIPKEPGHIRITSEKPVLMDLFIGAERALLLDTGYGEGPLAQEVQEYLAAQGKKDLPLTIVNTHAHWDHACGNPQFDCSVYMNSKELPLYDRVCPGHRATEDLEEGMVFDLGGVTLRAAAFSGHTDGGMALYWEEERILFTGDSMNPTFWIFLPECGMLSEYIAALEKAREIPMRGFYIAHREGIFDPKELDRFLYVAEHVDYDHGIPFDAERYGVEGARICAPWGKTQDEMHQEGLPYLVISPEHMQ